MVGSDGDGMFWQRGGCGKFWETLDIRRFGHFREVVELWIVVDRSRKFWKALWGEVLESSGKFFG